MSQGRKVHINENVDFLLIVFTANSLQINRIMGIKLLIHEDGVSLVNPYIVRRDGVSLVNFGEQCKVTTPKILQISI